jgi:hypothetical protein
VSNYLPIMALCLGLVFVMAGGGAKGWRAGESILVVVLLLLGAAAIFGFILARQ